MGGQGKFSVVATRLRERFFVKNKYDVLQELLRSLKFFLNALIIGFSAQIILAMLPETFPQKWEEKITFLTFCIFFITMTSIHYFFKSRRCLREIREDSHFINSEEARMLIVGVYMRANRFLKSILRKIFPLQLLDM